MAGVSIGTASHVVTGSVPVTSRLRKRVLAAIKTLNYQPDHIARSLRNRRTQTIGIIVPDLTISFFPKVIRGAEEAARERGYWLIAVNSDDDGTRQRELLSLLQSRRVDGILLAVAAAPAPLRQVARAMAAGIPVVSVDRLADRLMVDSVTVDDQQAVALGIEHLLSQGYRNIAIVTGPMILKNERYRLLAYKETLRRAGLPDNPHLVWEGNLRTDAVAQLCSRRLSVPGPRPDGILATNGPTALGVLQAFRDCGLRTPGDIGLVAFDELTATDLFSPSITTIIQPAYEIGRRAAQLLLDRIEARTGADSPPRSAVRLPARLDVRDSSRCLTRVAT